MYSLVAVSAELAEQLVAVEVGGEDAVHQARTRVRRLRSVLSVYKKAFDPDANRRLRSRLDALGALLGRARDLEVRATALERLLRDETDPDVIVALEALIADARNGYTSAVTSLVAHLRTRAHRLLLADLQLYAAEPPLTQEGRKHPRRITRKGLAKAAARTRRTGDDTLEERHATRKAARRLRYAAEAVADDVGRDAVHLASAAEAVQDALGTNRDLLLLGRFLREQGQPGLAVRCERDAEDALDGVERALHDLAKASLPG